MVILVQSKVYAILILIVVDVKLWDFLVVLMVSSHFCSCDVYCWSRSRIGILKCDFSFKGTRCWSLAYTLATRIFSLYIRMWPLSRAVLPWSLVLHASQYAIHPLLFARITRVCHRSFVYVCFSMSLRCE